MDELPWGVRRALAGSAGLGLATLLMASCQDATQITFEISTNAACEDITATGIRLGSPEKVETPAQPVVTEGCKPKAGPGGRARIGSIVAVPSGDDDATVALRVVIGLGKSPEDCVLDAYQASGSNEKGCLVARRIMRFIPHTSLIVPVSLDLDCLGIACSPEQTCSLGQCVSATCAEGQCGAGDGGSDGGGDATQDATEAGSDASTEAGCSASDPDIGKPCIDASKKGVCASGTWQCASDVKNCEATTQPAPTETCGDGLDNTCDGNTDEGCECSPPETKSCYTGPAGTLGKGICKSGTVACKANGTWDTTCSNQTLPASSDPCNGVDDDCDGQTDENLGTTTCGTGACERTVANCVGGAPQACVPGTPNNTFQTTVAPNGSWDWDCDGSQTTEKQYVIAATTSNCSFSSPDMIAACNKLPNTTAQCSGIRYFACGSNTCGGQVMRIECVANNPCTSCAYSICGGAMLTQGCK